jgi:hypothetical protein
VDGASGVLDIPAAGVYMAKISVLPPVASWASWVWEHSQGTSAEEA